MYIRLPQIKQYKQYWHWEPQPRPQKQVLGVASLVEYLTSLDQQSIRSHEHSDRTRDLRRLHQPRIEGWRASYQNVYGRSDSHLLPYRSEHNDLDLPDFSKTNGDDFFERLANVRNYYRAAVWIWSFTSWLKVKLKL